MECLHRFKSLLIIVLNVITLTFCKTCNVLDYGAKGDGRNLDTEAIQTAINSCNSANELNTILFPSSYNFLTFPFKVMYDIIIQHYRLMEQ